MVRGKPTPTPHCWTASARSPPNTRWLSSAADALAVDLPVNATKAKPTPTGPLQGIRIVDMTSVLMGPFATQILADYGADVIKIESEQGDLLRLGGAMRSPKMGALYLQSNRNKRSAVLDVKSD